MHISTTHCCFAVVASIMCLYNSMGFCSSSTIVLLSADRYLLSCSTSRKLCDRLLCLTPHFQLVGVSRLATIMQWIDDGVSAVKIEIHHFYFKIPEMYKCIEKSGEEHQLILLSHVVCRCRDIFVCQHALFHLRFAHLLDFIRFGTVRVIGMGTNCNFYFVQFFRYLYNKFVTSFSGTH